MEAALARYKLERPDLHGEFVDTELRLYGLLHVRCSGSLLFTALQIDPSRVMLQPEGVPDRSAVDLRPALTKTALYRMYLIALGFFAFSMVLFGLCTRHSQAKKLL